jgi:hypothetical protein
LLMQVCLLTRRLIVLLRHLQKQRFDRWQIYFKPIVLTNLS